MDRDDRLVAQVGLHGGAIPRSGWGYAVRMAIDQPHLEPDPFDQVVEAMLADPAIRADLDEQHELLRRGELKTHSNNEARKIVGLPPEADEA